MLNHFFEPLDIPKEEIVKFNNHNTIFENISKKISELSSSKSNINVLSNFTPITEQNYRKRKCSYDNNKNKKKKCWKCKQEGHDAFKCPNKRQNKNLTLESQYNPT